MSDFRLDVSFPTPGTLRLSVTGELDAESSEVLLRTAASAAHSVQRLEVDLARLSGFTPAGAWALAACRRLSTLLADGVIVHTRGAAGRDLLVASIGASG